MDRRQATSALLPAALPPHQKMKPRLLFLLAFAIANMFGSSTSFLVQSISRRSRSRDLASRLFPADAWRPGSFVVARMASSFSDSPRSRPPPRRSNSGKDRRFQRGDKIFVEITSFGTLGASVDVVGIGHDDSKILPGGAEPLGRGLVLQNEIHYFRQLRDNVDLIRGEIIPAFVADVRENGDLAIGLRSFGGKAKAMEVGDMIIQQLEESDDGTLPVGDKSSPDEIASIFPGVSKAAFKKAVGNLFSKGRVRPSPNSITLMKLKK